MHYLPLFLLLVILRVPAEIAYHGKIANVTDGNTHTILVEQEQVNLRLSDIDTPEGALNK